MVLDLTNVQEHTFLDEAGHHTLKIISIDESGTTANGNKVLKVTMKDKFERLITDDFVLTDNALWKIKALTKACKLPNVVDTQMLISRYVEADVVLKDETTKSGNVFKKSVIAKYSESNLTNTYVQVEVKKPVEVEDEYNPFG